MKTSALLFLLAVIGVALSSVAAQEDDKIEMVTAPRGRNLKRRRKRRPERPSEQEKAVCYEVLNTWWADRKEDAYREAIVDMDNYCDNYSGDADACNFRSHRQNYGHLPQEVLDAYCIMVGTNSDRCIANSCNQLNNGDCTLQATGGTCIWYNDEDIIHVNMYYRSMGSDLRVPGRGCYRNPCNQPGYGKMTKKKCTDLSIPNVLECTLCDGGRKDKRLRKEAMGCQASKATSEADCAPVNNAAFPPETIFYKIENADCQCTNVFPLCHQRVVESEEGKSTGMRPRFPEARP